MAYRDIVLADNPTHYWPMVEGGGTITADLIALGGQGASVAASLGYKGITASDGSANIANAANNGFIGLQSLAYLPAPPGVGPFSGFTMEAWVWMWALTSTYGEVLMYGPNGNDTELLINQTGTVAFSHRGGTGTTLTSASPLTLATWHHLVATASAKSPSTGVANLYLDGNLIVTNPAFGAAYPATGVFGIGVFTDRSQPFNGYVASPALYQTQLSLTRIQAHYNGAELELQPPIYLGQASQRTLDLNNAAVLAQIAADTVLLNQILAAVRHTFPTT